MGCRRLLGAEDRAAIMARLNAGLSLTRIALGLGLCCWHFVKRVCVPAASEVPVRGTRRRLTPEYRRDVASLVLDTGSSIASVARDLGLGESVVGRWVKLERERRQAAAQGRPDPRELEAEITVPSRRVRELEKEREFLGKASAFFASVHHNTSVLS